jgi:hypothetical protein
LPRQEDLEIQRYRIIHSPLLHGGWSGPGQPVAICRPNGQLTHGRTAQAEPGRPASERFTRLRQQQMLAPHRTSCGVSIDLHRPLKKAHNSIMLWDHPTIRPQLDIFVLIVTTQRALCGSSVEAVHLLISQRSVKKKVINSKCGNNRFSCILLIFLLLIELMTSRASHPQQQNPFSRDETLM